MTKEKILVTGAGGFLGSHFCNYFNNKGHQIVGVGRFSHKTLTSSSNCMMEFGLTLPDNKFVKIVNEFQPTILIHCAGTASVSESVQNPYRDFQKTVEVCAFTLETIRKEVPKCKFIFLSSAATYGNPTSLPISETACLQPLSPYGYHKMICETLVEEYSTLHGLTTIILRIFSAYGEGLQRQVIYDLFKKFTDTKSDVVEVFGTGEETRDFIHAVDVAKAIELIVNSNKVGIFNVASGKQTKISSLVDIISETFAHRKKVVYTGSSRQGDPLFWEADINKLTNLGFNPSISLELGIKKYCEWFKSLELREHL